MATYNPTTWKKQLTIPSWLVLPTVLPWQDWPDTKKIIWNPVFKGDKIVGSTGTKIVSNTPEKTSVYDNVLGTAKWSNPVEPPVEESLESILASNKATLESNQNNQNNQTNTVKPVNNFVWTSPTSTTRVVKKELQKQQNDFTPPTYDEIATMDENKLYDAIDRLELKLNKNQELSDEETLSLKALQRQAKKIGTPQNLWQPVEQLVQEQKNDIIQTQEARAEQDIKELQAFVQSQEAYKQASLDLIEQEAQENIKTLWYILGAQWASTSSYWAEAIQKIQQTAMLQKQAKIAEIQAKIDLYWSQLRKDSQETIQNMKDKLYQTQMVSAQYDVENIRTVNEYNLKKSQSTVERLQNLEKLANEVIKSNRPLTEQEAQQAQSWAESLIKPDGSVDTTLLKILQETNPVIAWLALQQSVSTAKERINFAQQDNILNRKYKQAQIDKLNKEETGTRSKIDLPDWSTGLLNNKTGEVRNSTGASSIDRSTATQQYGTTPAIRNFNPWNITDLSFGGQKVAGERFTVFDSPEEWLQALVDKIQYNQTNPSSSYYGSTIASYFERYAPRGSNNPESYAQDVARKLGVNVNTPISQLSPDRFAWAIASHEDTNNFKMLKDLWLVNDDYSLNLWNQANTIASTQNIELPTKATEWTKKALWFAQKMEDAHNKLLSLWLEKAFSDRWVWWQYFQEKAPEFAKSTKQKDLETLKQAFITWVLRQESWAAVTDTEFERYDKQFFPQVWDNIETIEKKQALRENAIRAMYQNAGKDINGNSIVWLYDTIKQASQNTPQQSGKTVVRTGKTKDWKPVVEYSDWSIEYK